MTAAPKGAPCSLSGDRSCRDAISRRDALTIVGLDEAARKREATLRARLALRGIALHLIEGDDGRPRWIANQHALTRSFASLDELEQWVDMVDGRRSGPAA